MSAKDELRDSRNPPVTCPKGHGYRVPRRFFLRNVRKRRDFRCPECFTAFKVKGIVY